MARIGDWLVVRARTNSGHDRRGEILEVHGAHGLPPYLVHWVDTGAQSLVFPGPDAQVMNEEQIAELERLQNLRIGRVQHEIAETQDATSV